MAEETIMEEDILYSVYDTSFGDITLIATDEALLGLRFGPEEISNAYNEENDILMDAICQINQYSFGQRKAFDIPLSYQYACKSESQRKVYEALLTIPYGKVRSYEAVAKELGVGAALVEGACQLNPIPLFIPCHRLIHADGKVGSYAGGSDLKTKLVKMEHANAFRTFRPADYKDED